MNDVEKNQIQEIELLLTESETQPTFSKELIRAEKVKILVSKLDCFTIFTQSNVHNVVNEKKE